MKKLLLLSLLSFGLSAMENEVVEKPLYDETIATVLVKDFLSNKLLWLNESLYNNQDARLSHKF